MGAPGQTVQSGHQRQGDQDQQGSSQRHKTEGIVVLHVMRRQTIELVL